MSEESYIKPRILLAEDDKSISELVALILNEVYHVITPNNYEELEALMLDRKFDLILLDISLWGNDFTSLVDKIKSYHYVKNTPIILLSANANARLYAKKINASEIIEKPFDVNTLLKTIKKYLNL